jgi:hypothetical protein
MSRRPRWLVVVSVAAALVAAAVLILLSRPRTPAPPPGAVPAPPTLPAGAVRMLSTRLADGSSYTLRYVDRYDRTVGVAAALDGSVFRVVVVSGGAVTAVLRDLPTSRGPLFNGFVLAGGSIYWTETTVRDDGTDLSQLWAASIDGSGVGPARLLVPDMGFADLAGSATDVVVAGGTISWTAVARAGQQGTLVMSVPERGGPVTQRSWPGSWQQLARPWLVSVGAGATILLNQETGEQRTVPGSDVAPTSCAAAWCRVTVIDAGNPVRLELVGQDGTHRTRVAGPGTSFATVDVAPAGRFEVLTQTGNDLPSGQARLLLYDEQAATTRLVETGAPTLVYVRDNWAWWLGGFDAGGSGVAAYTGAPQWHLLDLTSL